MRKPIVLFSSLFLAVVLIAADAVAVPVGGGNSGGGKSGGSKSSSSTKNQKQADKSSGELEDLTSKLTLTDPQKAQVKSILDGRDAQITVLKKEKLPKDEAKDKSKVIKEAAEAKIRTILTPDQQKTYDGMTKKGGKKNKEAEPAIAPAATSTTAPGSTTP
jgi:preprotein translocase subunit SecF